MMNGRVFFQKYGHTMRRVSKALSLLPKRYRMMRFEMLRNKGGYLGILKRYLWLCTLAKSVGDNVVVFPFVFFENIENLQIGDNVSIHQMCYIDAEGGICIGNNVSIAHRCTVLSSNHRYDKVDTPIKYQGMQLAQTVLQDNIWIGCGSAVMAGVRIKSGCVIGANSTVTRSIPENSVVVGSPAKVIKKRGKEAE